MTPTLRVRLGLNNASSTVTQLGPAGPTWREVWGALPCQRDVRGQEMGKTGPQAGEAPETGNGVGGLLLAPLWG